MQLRRLARCVWEERAAVFFCLWFLSILVAGNGVGKDIRVAGVLALIYIAFDVVYYGAHVLLFTRPLMKAILQKRTSGKRSLSEGVVVEMAAARGLVPIVWLIMLVGAAQPITTYVVARRMSLGSGEYAALYAYLVFDLLSTVAVWGLLLMNVKKQRDGYVRKARLTDVEQLSQLEAEAFPDPDQQWSIDQVRLALETSLGRTLVYERHGEIRGALYTRCVRSEALDDEELLWADLAGDGDLSPVKGADTLYGVNLLARPTDANVADKLLAHAYAEVVRSGMRFLMGCVRLPGYCRYADHNTAAEYLGKPGVREKLEGQWPDVLRVLESPRRVTFTPQEYVFATTRKGKPLDPMVRKTLADLTLVVWGRSYCLAKVARCIEGYFGDPPSLDTGALLVMKNPISRHKLLGIVLAPFVRKLMLL